MRQRSMLSSVSLAVALSAGAGCLSAPTGQAADASAIDAATDAEVLTWPPPSANIVALAAGPVDGDAIDDVVAVDTGNGRVYLLKGGTDLRVGDPVTSVTRVATIAGLRPPASAVVVPGTPSHILVLDSPTMLTRVTFFNADLRKTGESTMENSTLAANNLVTLNTSVFGMPPGGSVWVGTPTKFAFIENGDLGVASPMLRMPVSNPNLEPLADIRQVNAYITPGMPRAFVAEPTRIQRADVAGTTFTWTTVRTGDTWTGHTVADMTGDGRADVVGYLPVPGTPASSKVCITDVDLATTACATTPFQMASAAMKVGDITGAGKNDVVLLDPMGPGGTGVFVATDVHFDGANVVTPVQTQPFNLTASQPRMAFAQLDSGGKEIIVSALDGALSCLEWNVGALAPCAP